jgi:hypothetical protein
MTVRSQDIPMPMLTFSTADIISTVEFDHTGNYLATGDKGGRVVLFERNESVNVPSSLKSEDPNN